VIVGPLIGLGIYDACQTQHAVLRNFPLLGHGRYLMEMIRPEVSQYFIELDTSGRPFNREERSLVYQRAKGETDTLPFGTRQDVYAVRYEWLNYSLAPQPVLSAQPRILIGEASCSRPYAASLLNISAMSFGALSKNAILALNGGAKLGGFAHNTGEGGISPYHLAPGGDLIWQIGTGYFGCRTLDGRFDPDQFRDTARLDQIKMIELKLSQGAKPGHGGVLPGTKVSTEIAQIRGVEPGQTIISPSAHTAFSTPEGLLVFVARLRELSDGKPVGFKLCVGNPQEVFSIGKAMLNTGITPDFITVDGAEGGTGAAPLEFSNSVGMPLDDGLVLIHNTLVGLGVRDQVKVIASGRILSGFHIATRLALGADLCNAARSMMFALGCIQALRCNTNKCPVGVATQNPQLVKGLYVPDKTTRVANFHTATVQSFLELLAAAGLSHPTELQPFHICRRVSLTEVRHYGEIFSFVEPGAFLGAVPPARYVEAWAAAQATSFHPQPGTDGMLSLPPDTNTTVRQGPVDIPENAKEGNA
jgi:glutamate synthase domain-containing protein 2